MKKIILLLLTATQFALSGCTQNSSQGNSSSGNSFCEGCEAFDESPQPFDKLGNLVWLPDWNDKGPKLAVNGVVYKADGKTPAPGVVIYIYHTDQKGIYPTRGTEKGWDKRHGYLRGWMRTNEKGEYKFFTLKPASYPGRTAPAHIHVFIKEPSKKAYWIDDYLFDDDPILTQAERTRLRNRGGSGILKTKQAEEILKAERHIILGKNVSEYSQL